MKKHLFQVLLYAVIALFVSTIPARAESLKPFILGNPPPGEMSMKDVVNLVELELASAGFNLAGSYVPYPAATVIVVTDNELKAAAARAENGGFGVGERVAVTMVDGKFQVSYVNPAYMGTAYGLGKLPGVTIKLKMAIGNTVAFGSKNGIDEKALAPGNYHYMMGMPYFADVDRLATYPDYATAVATVEKNLAAHAGGTTKVYRIDLPGKQVSVFGIAIDKGDGLNSGTKDTDSEIMNIIDFGPYRATAYLPYELMVQGNHAIALAGRYRIALNFPDTTMMGAHGFTKIMSSPRGILKALTAVAALPPDESQQ